LLKEVLHKEAFPVQDLEVQRVDYQHQHICACLNTSWTKDIKTVKTV
jgi:hypothetical protein